MYSKALGKGECYRSGNSSDENVFNILNQRQLLAIAESIFDFGIKLLCECSYDLAIKWLSQTLETVVSQEDVLFADIRVKTLQNLAKAHLSRGDESDLHRVASLIELGNEVATSRRL